MSKYYVEYNSPTWVRHEIFLESAIFADDEAAPSELAVAAAVVLKHVREQWNEHERPLYRIREYKEGPILAEIRHSGIEYIGAPAEAEGTPKYRVEFRFNNGLCGWQRVDDTTVAKLMKPDGWAESVERMQQHIIKCGRIPIGDYGFALRVSDASGVLATITESLVTYEPGAMAKLMPGSKRYSVEGKEDEGDDLYSTYGVVDLYAAVGPLVAEAWAEGWSEVRVVTSEVREVREVERPPVTKYAVVDVAVDGSTGARVLHDGWLFNAREGADAAVYNYPGSKVVEVKL